jgi:hypothetical protein
MAGTDLELRTEPRTELRTELRTLELNTNQEL